MRIAIFGDIHSNLEALTAVLNDAKALGCTSHECTGDIVGENASPVECVEIVRVMGCALVKGDMDEHVCGDTPLDVLHPPRKRALAWARDQLAHTDKEWLRSQPMVRELDEHTIVHATLDEPGRWEYVLGRTAAECSFHHQRKPLCFFGHTHIPQFYVSDGGVETQPPHSIRIERGKKYFINVGSVGQPQDGDWRACYAIYDTEDRTVTIRRVPYDLDTARQRIRDVGLD